MRDLLLVGFLFVAIYFCFKRPFLGIASWAWISLMAPANWAFGFSSSFRLNLTIVLVTVISYIVVQKRKTFAFNSLSFWILLFAIWTLITSFTSLHSISNYATNYWQQFIKVLIFYFFITLMINKKLHIDTLIWAIVLAISSYAAMESVKFILSGGGHMVTGRAGAIRDRNDFAVAVNMCIPLIVYLIYATRHSYLKLGLWGLLLMNILAIVGTGSRGGFIGLSILALAFWWKSKRKLLWALLAIIILPTAYQYTPEHWRERQSTIETASTDDASFIGRLWAWKIAVMVARDHPITGAGFMGATDHLVWHSYAPFTPFFGPIETPEIPEGSAPKAAHNIYFQVLGDHGYVGLTIFLMILMSILWINRSNRIKAKKHQQPWCEKLSAAISLSLIGFCVTGANVSLAYFDLFYALAGIVSAISIYKLYQSPAPQAAVDPATQARRQRAILLNNHG